MGFVYFRWVKKTNGKVKEKGHSRGSSVISTKNPKMPTKWAFLLLLLVFLFQILFYVYNML